MGVALAAMLLACGNGAPAPPGCLGPAADLDVAHNALAQEAPLFSSTNRPPAVPRTLLTSETLSRH